MRLSRIAEMKLEQNDRWRLEQSFSRRDQRKDAKCLLGKDD
jgi:hypothetical protein